MICEPDDEKSVTSPQNEPQQEAGPLVLETMTKCKRKFSKTSEYTVYLDGNAWRAQACVLTGVRPYERSRANRRKGRR